MIKRSALQVVRGFCMGASDIVPGVSGGTIALVFGIYTRLIETVRHGASVLGRLVRADLRGAWANARSLDWWFLVPLAVGVGLAFLALAHLIETLLDEEPVNMAGLFLGLVVGSIVVTAAEFHRTPGRLGLMAAVAVAAFGLLGLRSGATDDPAFWFVFVAGAIAICAMILPGISGSFLLLMLGMYEFVLGSVTDRDLVVLAVFALGALLGLAGFSTALAKALERFPDAMMAALVGLMLGSLRVLWPWPNGIGGAEGGLGEGGGGSATELALPSGEVVGPVLLALVGFAVVVVVSRLARSPAPSNEAEAIDALDDPRPATGG